MTTKLHLNVNMDSWIRFDEIFENFEMDRSIFVRYFILLIINPLYSEFVDISTIKLYVKVIVLGLHAHCGAAVDYYWEIY